MTNIKSFRDVINDRYIDTISNSLSSYLGDNADTFVGYSNKVSEAEESSLSDVDIKFIDIKRAENSTLYFDVVIEAEIEISMVKRHGDMESDSCFEWYRISCKAVFDGGIKGFKVIDIHHYSKNKSARGNLSEYLVPIIKPEHIEDEAMDFLKKYCPEALEKPMRVNPTEIVNRMGLAIQEAHITKNCSVFGQIFFKDCITQCYDEKDNNYQTVQINRGTILVDPKVYFMRSLGSVNNTIIHECVHWDKHKMFFELESLYNQNARSITCQVSENEQNSNKDSPFSRMEWQANVLAPRILMPYNTTKILAKQLVDKYTKENPSANRTAIMESVILELANFFQVSKMAAKIRMMDIGYPDAEGVLTYLNGQYISNYSFEPDTIKKGQTFTIGTKDAAIEYLTNKKFQETLSIGNYVYINGHYCIDTEKYITKNKSNIALTEYASSHLDECCLVFDVKVNKNKSYGSVRYTECFLYRDGLTDTKGLIYAILTMLRIYR